MSAQKNRKQLEGKPVSTRQKRGYIWQHLIDMERVSELYLRFSDMLILNAIPRNSPESQISEGASLADRIRYALEELNQTWLYASSFAFGRNSVSNLFDRAGIIIKDAELIATYTSDSGITRASFAAGVRLDPSHEIGEVIYGERADHNEIILKNAACCGIWVSDKGSSYSEDEFIRASREFDLPVYLHSDDGMRLLVWNETENVFRLDTGRVALPAEVLAR